jgi:kynureninase
MAVSGTYNFNLDIDEVIQEAMEMIGGENTLGHEPASARRSINLMLKDWQNRGILLWSTSVSSSSYLWAGILYVNEEARSRRAKNTNA